MELSEKYVIFVVENKYALMKTFKEYYDMGLADELKWLGMPEQASEWWKSKSDNLNYLGIRGKYPETTKFLTEDERNDVSLFHNHTNVKNSEWSILHFMMGQALVDWCREKGATWEELWCYSLCIEKNEDTISLKSKIKKYDEDYWEYEQDEEKTKYFVGLDEFLKDMLFWFFDEHKGDIPLDWNWFGFSLDALSTSVKYGEWVPASDGSMNFGLYNPEKKEYIDYVESM